MSQQIFDYAKHFDEARKAREKKCAKNKKTLLAALKRLKVEEVQVEYSGSGDSGGIDFVRVLGKDGKEIKPAGKVRVEQEYSVPPKKGTDVWERKIKSVSVELEDAIRDFVFDNLYHHISGWEINEGGQGVLTFYVKEGRVVLSHQQNVVVTEDSSFEL